MWIRNKVTNTLQEIHNADVIKICKKEPEKYELSEEYPGDNEEVKAVAQAAAEKKAEEEAEKVAKEAEAKAKAEGAAKKVEEEAAQAAAQAAGGEGAGNDATPEDYANKKINDLRKIAKEKGIQGYNNMDKATLAAVIQAH